MIMNDPINRFESNWGVYPTSIALANDETTKISATNIELAGKDWSNEGDFGDGLNGLPGFSKTTGLFGLGAPGLGEDSGMGFSLPDTGLDVSDWDWKTWALAIGTGYTVFNIVSSAVGRGYRSTKSSVKGAIKRRRDTREGIVRAKRRFEDAKAEASWF